MTFRNMLFAALALSVVTGSVVTSAMAQPIFDRMKEDA